VFSILDIKSCAPRFLRHTMVLAGDVGTENLEGFSELGHRIDMRHTPVDTYVIYVSERQRIRSTYDDVIALEVNYDT